MALKRPRVQSKMITPRERIILSLIAEGYKNKEIAKELYINEKIVRENQMNLMIKLNVQNVSSLIGHALGKGWINTYEVLESRYSKRKHKDLNTN